MPNVNALVQMQPMIPEELLEPLAKVAKHLENMFAEIPVLQSVEVQPSKKPESNKVVVTLNDGSMVAPHLADLVRDYVYEAFCASKCTGGSTAIVKDEFVPYLAQSFSAGSVLQTLAHGYANTELAIKLKRAKDALHAYGIAKSNQGFVI